MLISQCLKMRKQQCDAHTEFSTWLSHGYAKAHSPVALDYNPTTDPYWQASTLALDFCPLAGHCPQRLTSVSGTTCLWTQGFRHSLLRCSLSSHTVILFYKLPAAIGMYSIHRNCLGYMQTLNILYTGDEQSQIWILGILEPMPWVYWGMAVCTH